MLGWSIVIGTSLLIFYLFMKLMSFLYRQAKHLYFNYFK